MKQTKKIIISILFAILALFAIGTINSNAYYVGQSYRLNYNEYADPQSGIFCVEHHQNIGNGIRYKIISQVKIEGRTSTDYTGRTQESSENARLAYILNADNGTGHHKGQGPVAQAVWNNIYTWMSVVGKNHAGLYQGFASPVKGVPTSLDTESANYANSLGNLTEITDNTNKDKIKVVAYNKDGNSYMRVGPFNWTFSGTMTNIIANDQNGEAISGILYSSFNGNNEVWYGANGIKSGKDFYLSVPMSTDITKITRVTGQANVNVKAVNIWFLESVYAAYQNLIIKEPYEATVPITTPFDYDIPTLGNLKIIKVNKDNEAVKLKGVGFKIQHKQTGKYVHQDATGKITYVTEAEATEFITDTNGEILIKNLVVGTYVAYETKNPNYGYEMLTEGQEKEVLVDQTNEITIKNKQIYVKLSGYAWVDKPLGEKELGDRNDVFKTDQNAPDSRDILFNGITVRLKDRTNGSVIQTTTTNQLNRYNEDEGNDGNGEYLFMDVLIEKLQDYYIEFEYDGLTYTNVVPHIDQNRGSKAAESVEVRENFNKDFSVIEGSSRTTGYTKDQNSNKKYDLSYNIQEGNMAVATLINNGQYTITATTDVPDYKIRNHFTYGQEEVKYINLGLYEREQPDIALAKDLHNVRLTVNGYEHTYYYSQRLKPDSSYEGGFNVGVIYENPANMSYKRAIYQSDYDYINENDKSRELKAYVTYQITMFNQSESLTAQVNSIADYHNSNYEMVKAGTVVDARGNIGTSIDQNGNAVGEVAHEPTEKYNESYNKTIINNNTKIEAEKNQSIYVQFVINREEIKRILEDKEAGNNANDSKDDFRNVAEINSYSIFDKNNNIYAGIDKDSNPGNSTPGESNTYEDDTAASPALRLEVTNAREIAGKVFLDETSGELKTGEIRQGSGEYEEGEKGIEGVDITLTENTGSGKVYTTKTDANGDFLLTGYIPGDYTLTYTWGDQTYTVQNYKGTIYKNEERQNNKQWYKEEQPRLSDAMDNYNTRKEIDQEMQKVTSNTQITKTKMESTTPTMGIGIEYETLYSASTGDKYTYRINNVDFGIVERARQDLKVEKRIKTFKVTLPNGQVVVDVTIDEDGNITGDRNNITYMKPGYNVVPSNGFIRLELDNELMQGSVLEVGYGIKVTNRSEVEYLSENYYQYGKVEGEVATIEPSGLIDYLDKNWSFDQSKNPQWEVKTIEQIQDLVADIVFEHEETTIGDKMILHTQGLKGQHLKPEQAAEIDLTVSKMLTTTDETSYDNEVEIVELNRTGGSKPVSTPGNYVPGTGYFQETEVDDARAETAIVTPATGGNYNYMIPVMIGITAFVILGAGVIIIKKKVMTD